MFLFKIKNKLSVLTNSVSYLFIYWTIAYIHIAQGFVAIIVADEHDCIKGWARVRRLEKDKDTGIGVKDDREPLSRAPLP